MALARASPDAGATGALKRACEEWNAALADGTGVTRKARRKLCADHGIECKRAMQKDSEEAARVARSELAQRLQALLLWKSTGDRFTDAARPRIGAVETHYNKFPTHVQLGAKKYTAQRVQPKKKQLRT